MDTNEPRLDKDGEEWVLKVYRAGPIRIPVANRALAVQVMEAATWAYRNGRMDQLHEVRAALGFEQ